MIYTNIILTLILLVLLGTIGGLIFLGKKIGKILMRMGPMFNQQNPMFNNPFQGNENGPDSEKLKEMYDNIMSKFKI
jgi:hypothetical protein